MLHGASRLAPGAKVTAWVRRGRLGGNVPGSHIFKVHLRLVCRTKMKIIVSRIAMYWAVYPYSGYITPKRACTAMYGLNTTQWFGRVHSLHAIT